MKIRGYRPALHLDQCREIWREVGWLPDFPEGVRATEEFFSGNPCLVAELDKRVEALAVAVPGVIRHLGSILPFWAVTSVTVGHAGRKKGLASALTAEITALGAQEGCLLAGLGIFEQGYYNRMGYGNGPCNRIVTFRPSDLPGSLPSPGRTCRLSLKDIEEVVLGVRNRMPCHGQVTLSGNFYKASIQWENRMFGLGCRNREGALTHQLWYTLDSGEHGPCRVLMMSYPDSRRLMELMGMIRSLGDQIDLAVMEEPPHLQFQDLMRTPIRNERMLRGSRHPVGVRSLSYVQVRILDLARVMESTSVPWGESRFNLTLSDPAGPVLSRRTAWRGCSGEYTVVLGPEGRAEPGHTRGLRTMRAGVGAFTRLWLGVRPPSVLAVTDEIEAPPSLLAELDGLLRLPEPRINCDF